MGFPPVSSLHLVRIGVLGHVGRFRSLDARCYPRRTRVVCRTARGLEVGQVLSVTQGAAEAVDGQLLRALTAEDDLLLARLEKNKNAAFTACREQLEQRDEPVTLVDVELLFDGTSLYFYFLGDVSPQVELLTGKLAEAYEAEVKLRDFAATLSAGCGPTCGTEESSGCGVGGCATCAVAAACSSPSSRPE